MVTVTIVIISISLSQLNINEIVKSILLEHYFKVVVFSYIIFSICVVVSIITYIPNEQVSSRNENKVIKYMTSKVNSISQKLLQRPFRLIDKVAYHVHQSQINRQMFPVDEIENIDEQEYEPFDMTEEHKNIKANTKKQETVTKNDRDIDNSGDAKGNIQRNDGESENVMPKSILQDDQANATSDDTKENVQRNYGGSKLHKIFTGCMKNPGHTEFIPVDTFTIKHLPKGHRDNDLYKFVKVTADLTVRVFVTMASPHRPEFWPNTHVSYPFYNMRDKTNCRTGSGMVKGVDKFTNGYSDGVGKHWENYTTCWCKQCLHSDTASHVWWEFDVHTATHVVFDDIEASHTSLRLFYDREESSFVRVDQVSVVDANIERDMCLLRCVTCDKNLGDKMDMLRRHYDDVWSNVLYKYRETRDVDKLSFIVSHPHGCCKQVSVGHWVDKYNERDDLYKFTYTTCTCPGSAGAPVNILGYEVYPGDHLIHSGCLNSKLNYSGAAHLR